MGLSQEQLRKSMDALAAMEPGFRAALGRVGYPEPRIRPRGYETLLRTIVGQQVSVKAAAAVWSKLETLLGEGCAPGKLLASEFDALRSCGLSRQKQGYARSLADLVMNVALELHALRADDEASVNAIVAFKGIGLWSAESDLLVAEGRPDVGPAGDLAVQSEVGRILGLSEGPTEKVTREVAERWRPHRGAAALMAFHHDHTSV